MEPKKKEVNEIVDAVQEWAELDPTEDREFMAQMIREEEIYAGCDPEYL